MVWYSHFLKNVQVVVIHIVKCFGVVNKAEVALYGVTQSRTLQTTSSGSSSSSEWTTARCSGPALGWVGLAGRLPGPRLAQPGRCDLIGLTAKRAGPKGSWGGASGGMV